MQYRWMVEVLSDLRRFAEANALPETGKALDAMILVAENEISRPGKVTPHDSTIVPISEQLQ